MNEKVSQYMENETDIEMVNLVKKLFAMVSQKASTNIKVNTIKYGGGGG